MDDIGLLKLLYQYLASTLQVKREKRRENEKRREEEEEEEKGVRR